MSAPSAASRSAIAAADALAGAGDQDDLVLDTHMLTDLSID